MAIDTVAAERRVTLPSVPLDHPIYEARIQHAAAYLTVESCGIFAIESAMCFTPSGLMLLWARLQATRVAVEQIWMCVSARFLTHSLQQPDQRSPQLDEALTSCQPLCESSRSTRPKLVVVHPKGINEESRRFNVRVRGAEEQTRDEGKVDVDVTQVKGGVNVR